MAKTICLVHGVGFYDDKVTSPISVFAGKLHRATGAECIIHTWSHPGTPPNDTRSSFLFDDLRDWTYEILMDFTYVVENLAMLHAALPSADMYVGHSGGGIIAASGTKPMVLMGCPMQLLRNIVRVAGIPATLNLMHYRDPIAAPINVGTNVVLTRPISLLTYVNPVAAHTSYWKSDVVLKHVINWYKEKVEA